jgi:hypothetical protein
MRRASAGGNWQRHGHVDLGEAPVIFDVLAAADNAVGKRDARLSARKLAHLEASPLAAHIESPAIALWCDEHAIVAALDHLGEVRIEFYDRAAARELRAAKILEPVFRTLHAMEEALRSVWEWHYRALIGHGERAVDSDVADEDAGKACGVVRNAVDAVAVAGIWPRRQGKSALRTRPWRPGASLHSRVWVCGLRDARRRASTSGEEAESDRSCACARKKIGGTRFVTCSRHPGAQRCSAEGD